MRTPSAGLNLLLQKRIMTMDTLCCAMIPKLSLPKNKYIFYILIRQNIYKSAMLSLPFTDGQLSSVMPCCSPFIRREFRHRVLYLKHLGCTECVRNTSPCASLVLPYNQHDLHVSRELSEQRQHKNTGCPTGAEEGAKTCRKINP